MRRAYPLMKLNWSLHAPLFFLSRRVGRIAQQYSVISCFRGAGFSPHYFVLLLWTKKKDAQSLSAYETELVFNSLHVLLLILS